MRGRSELSNPTQIRTRRQLVTTMAMVFGSMSVGVSLSGQSQGSGLNGI